MTPPLTHCSGDFKAKLSLEVRTREAARIKAKFQDRIPVVVEQAAGVRSVPPIDRSRFLVPADLTLGQFMYVIRKRVKLSADQAIFIFANSHIPSSSMQMSEVAAEHGDVDGFLYLVYAGESTFGHSV